MIPIINLYDGVKQLMSRLKKFNPDMLLAGEGWYDGLAACIPLLQCGHTDGVLHWHDEAFPPMFDSYVRGFGHLCLGDVSRGSTGVHELGFNPIKRCPLRRGIIPTITITDGTLGKTAPGGGSRNIWRMQTDMPGCTWNRIEKAPVR